MKRTKCSSARAGTRGSCRRCEDREETGDAETFLKWGAQAAGLPCLAARQTLRETIFGPCRAIQHQEVWVTKFSATRRNLRAGRARSLGQVNPVVRLFEARAFSYGIRFFSFS